MSGLVKDRFRNQTVSFRVSPEEGIQLDARIKVCGMPRGQYFIQSLLHQQINIMGGKYQSDRLSLEMRRLHESIDALDSNSDERIEALLSECKTLLEQLKIITLSDLSPMNFDCFHDERG